MTLRQLQFAWNHRGTIWTYRRPLWKYRKLIQNRKQILTGASVAAAAILAGVLLHRSARCDPTASN
jgi:hypothetical protein